MCMGPRYSHPLQCSLALQHNSWDVQRSRECPAPLWKARDLNYVLVWQLPLEFSWALHQHDIFLLLLSFHRFSSPTIFYFISQAIKHLASLSLIQHFYTCISQNPFLTLQVAKAVCRHTHTHICSTNACPFPIEPPGSPKTISGADLRSSSLAKHMFCLHADISHPTAQTLFGITRRAAGLPWLLSDPAPSSPPCLDITFQTFSSFLMQRGKRKMHEVLTYMWSDLSCLQLHRLCVHSPCCLGLLSTWFELFLSFMQMSFMQLSKLGPDTGASGLQFVHHHKYKMIHPLYQTSPLGPLNILPMI